ncbi:MAG: DNA-3-methyladenine glycosylase 2 family protein [Candidatus Levybacteria bacterium]|nr:DNA-3-methyladenine glycosylase 2 family protein [Candidatus Levybacteria bacterium]
MKKLVRNIQLTELDPSDDLFLDIVETIINQQLSDKAASTIFGRFKKLFKSHRHITHKNALNLSDELIRQAGISYSKISYIKNTARAFINNEISIEKLTPLSDEKVISELTKIKGIGRWTAEMIMMFSLKRPDIFSVSDLGLCTAVSSLYDIDRKDKKKIEEISMAWIPYRSIACRYLWRSLEKKK